MALLGNSSVVTRLVVRRPSARRAARRARRALAVALGPVIAVGGTALPVVPTAIAGAAAVAAVSVATAPAAHAQPAGPVLVLAQNGEATAPEATLLQAAGYTVTQVTPATWQAMSTAQFEGYAALVIGDPSANGTCSTLIPTTGTSGTDALGTAWQAAVSGNIAVLGTAPALPATMGANALITDSAEYAAAGYNAAGSGTQASGTGLYTSLNCDYATASAGTAVPLLNGVEGIGTTGGLTVQGSLACTDPGTVNAWEAARAATFGGLTSSDLGTSAWGSACPVQEAFESWPAMFTPVGYDAATDAAQDFTASDGATGQPYVLLGAPVSSATAALAPAVGGEVVGGTTAGGTSNPAAPGVRQASAGDPVNTENGDFTQSATDMSLPGYGPALSFTRTYDAQAAQQETQAGVPGPLGYGWTDNWATSATAARPTPGDIYAVDGLRTGNGNGGAALTSIDSNPSETTVDSAGDIFFADTSDNRVQEIAGPGTTSGFGQSMVPGDVYTVAGQPNGQFELPLEGGLAQGLPATGIVLNHPEGVAVDPRGDLFIADTNNCRVVEVAAASGTQYGISMTADDAYTIAGQAGSCGFSGDGAPGTSAELDNPVSLHMGQLSHNEDLYIADGYGNRILELAATNEHLWGQGESAGDLYTVVGSPAGASGDTTSGTAASSSQLNDPQDVALNGVNMYIADTGNCRIAEVAGASGTQWGSISMTANDVYNVAGRNGPANCLVGNDGKVATQSDLDDPTSVRDPNGNLYIADNGNSRIQEVAGSSSAGTVGFMYTFASGISDPNGLWMDSGGTMYVSVDGGQPAYVAEIPAGSVSPVPLTGQTQYTLSDTGDGGPAYQSALNGPSAVATDSHGDVFIADTSNNRVQEIATWNHTQFGTPMLAGDAYTIAGQAASSAGYSGNGTTAASSFLDDPTGIAVDARGDLFIAESAAGVVQEIAGPGTTSAFGIPMTPGDIYTIAGTPGDTGPYAGNGGPATSAVLSASLDAVAVDTGGDVFISDSANNDVYEVPATAGSQYGVTMAAADIYVVAGSAGLSVPAAPSGLTVTGTTASSVSLSWTAPSGTVTGYDVYENGVQVATSTGTMATVTGLSASTAYTFTVAAVNSAGTGAQSSPVTATTASSGGTVPAAPTGLTVTATTTTTVSLSWTAPAGAVTGYNVYQGGTQVATATGTTATVTGLSASTAYTFTVAAVNSAGTGPQSVAVHATTSGSSSVPTGLTVTAVTTSSVSLSWTAPTGSVLGYEVFQNGTEVKTASGTTATVTGLAAATTYTFTVAAVGLTGVGAQSAPVQATTSSAGGGTVPAAPTGLTVLQTTGTTVDLGWTAPAGTVTGYLVYQNGTQLTSQVTFSGTQAHVSGLSPSTTYTFTVAAYNSAGTGPQSSPLSATTGSNPFLARRASSALAADGGYDPSGNSGDGGPGTSALLNGPTGLAVDSAGDVYISDSGNNQVRELAGASHAQWGQAMTGGDIYTVAGAAAGTAGSGGNAGPATIADLDAPQQIALDTAGDLYITDSANTEVREVAAASGAQWSQSMTAGDIYDVAGTATGTGSNGGPAASDEMWDPYGIGTDPFGDLYILQRGIAFTPGQLQEVAATAMPSIPAAPGQVSSLYPLTLPSDTGGITITQPGGSQVTFQPPAPGGGCASPYAQSGQYCVLPQFTGATLTASGANWVYSSYPGADALSYSQATGQLVAETDSAGAAVTVSYGTPSPGSGGCPSSAASCETITAASGRTLVIGASAASLVTSVTDPMGRSWTYAYDSSSQLISATGPMTGQVTSYTYGPGPNTSQDLASDLLTITGPNAQPGGPDAGDSTVNVYDALGRVVTQTDPMGFKTTFSYCVSVAAGDCMDPATGTGYVTVTDPDGNRTVYDYDQGTLAAKTQYTAASVTSEHDYNPLTWAGIADGGTLLDQSVTDGDGNTTTYAYNADGDVTSASSPGPDGTTTSTDGYTSGELGNCAGGAEISATASCSQDPGPSPVAPGSVITPPSAAPPEGITWTLYDTDGNALYTTMGVYEPGASSAAYLQTSYQLYNGNSVTLGGTTVSCAARAPSASLPCATINPGGVVTQLGYDPAGDVTSTSALDGNGSQVATTTFAYDADGEQASTTVPDGNLPGANAANYTTVTAWNADGNQTSLTEGSGSGATVTPRVTGYGYDADGNQTSVTDARDHSTTYAYNADDKVTLVTDPDGNATLTCFDGDGHAAQTVPPAGVAAGHLTPASCPASYPAGYGSRLAADATTSTFDAAGQRVQVTTPAPAGQSGHEITTFSYDGNGNLLQTDAPPASPGGTDQVTVDRYDSGGELTSRTTGYGTSAAATTAYCYSPQGDRTAVVAPDGNTSGTAPCEISSPWAVSPVASPAQAAYQTTYGYDSADELVTSTSPATAAAPNGATTTTTYDPVGNVIASTDPNGVITTYTYTPGNQVATVSYSGATAHSVSYSYDADGNETGMTDATGTSSYQDDPFRELTSVTNGAGQTVGYAYDANGDVTGISYPLPATATWAASGTVSYGYDNADQLTSVTDFAGNKIAITNDADGNPASQALGTTGTTITTSYDSTDRPSVISLANGSSTLQSFSYSDAPAGNIASEADTPSSPQAPAAYTYDGQGRVTSETPGSAAGLSYTYDASGNLIALPNGASGSYDHGSELTSAALSGTTTSYAYDADGEQLSSASGTTTLSSASWDGAGSLTGYADGAASMTAASYTGSGLRASATFTPAGGTAATGSYVWNVALQTPQLLMDSANAYIYGRYGTPVEQVSLSTGSVSYLISDTIGSVRGVMNSSGALTAATSYDAWGNPLTAGGLTTQTPFGFAGGYTDPDGLIYLINRYYEPSLGQFISVDPNVGETGQPYSYAADNPVNENDPDGDKASAASAKVKKASIKVASGGVPWLDYNKEHAAACLAAAMQIASQLLGQGYSPGAVVKGLQLERPVPGGSKKRSGFNGRADITWEFPVQGLTGVLVWEVKVWTYRMQASDEALYYAAAFNLHGVNTASAAGFDLNRVVYANVSTSAVVRVFSYGPGGILYEVQNTPRNRPQPNPQPNPAPVPSVYTDVIVFALLAGVVILAAVVFVPALAPVGV